MSASRRRDGRPQWIDDHQNIFTTLTRTDLSGKSGGRFDEAWLQQLLHQRPEVFPIEQIEPGFGQLVPICREFPVTFGAGRSGALDNVYLTPGGGLVLIEAKLWRNPESRRSVVAQTMEYAAAIFRMTYEEFELAAVKACGLRGTGRSLAQLVAEQAPELDEVEFIDAVARNLRRGRAVIAVVGDGIREDILPLTELLQSHAGHRFTFALVELAVYDTPSSGIRVVVPSVLAQTTLIERGVVTFKDDSGRLTVETPAPTAVNTLGAIRRAGSIGEDEFYELLGQRDPSWPPVLKELLAKAESVGVYAERQGGLNLKHASPQGQPLNLGMISKEGYVDITPSSWWDRKDAARIYSQTLASAFGGVVSEMNHGKELRLRTAAAKTPRLSDLLPSHGQLWVDAMQQYINDVFDQYSAGKG